MIVQTACVISTYSIIWQPGSVCYQFSFNNTCNSGVLTAETNDFTVSETISYTSYSRPIFNTMFCFHPWNGTTITSLRFQGYILSPVTNIPVVESWVSPSTLDQFVGTWLDANNDPISIYRDYDQQSLVMVYGTSTTSLYFLPQNDYDNIATNTLCQLAIYSPNRGFNPSLSDCNKLLWLNFGAFQTTVLYYTQGDTMSGITWIRQDNIGKFFTNQLS